MDISLKLQNKRKTKIEDPSFRARQERSKRNPLTWHSVAICPALGVDSLYLCFTLSGSFKSTLKKLQKISYCLLS